MTEKELEKIDNGTLLERVEGRLENNLAIEADDIRAMLEILGMVKAIGADELMSAYAIIASAQRVMRKKG